MAKITKVEDARHGNVALTFEDNSVEVIVRAAFPSLPKVGDEWPPSQPIPPAA